MRLGYTTDKPPVALTQRHRPQAVRDIAQQPAPSSSAGHSGRRCQCLVHRYASRLGEPLHRTVSLDFAIQVAGEIELTLSSGERCIIKSGDLAVQRLTLHKWRNPSKMQWSRMVGAMAECQPVVTRNGILLDVYIIPCSFLGRHGWI